MTNSHRNTRRARGLTARRAPARAGGGSARDGFTIIELIVAIVILVVGVLGLAGTAGMVSRMVGGAAQQTIAANVASSRFEKLRSVPCTQVKSGTATTRGMAEKWTATASPGNAQLYSVTDVVTYTAAGGRSRELTFQSYVPCD
ncbi:MAG TPA: prepilin-type N-terminal cleavage/methylation domain-containing protein [Gemmatimonadaceae bacterium]|nr:prepilin-type N-terminal cleavage/methylation domain-containing protein [Gemmatimonadaceae bacterium]